jgi:RND family efflux transporter MFP subunit
MKVHISVFFIGFSLITLMAAVNAAAMNDSGLDCIIEPSCKVNLGSEVSGIIEEITVDRGDLVHKGQVLVRLASKVELAILESKKASYEFARNEYKRRSGLYTKAMIPTRDFDESEMKQKVAEREVEEAEKKYELRTIRSPIDGVVVQRLLQPGERVEVEPILKLAQLSPLYVEIIAPASILGSVNTGDRAAVRPEDPIKGEYIGRVKIVDNVVDAASGTFGIRIELENKDYSLPSGLKCSVRFLGKNNTPKKPSRARGTSPQNSAWPKLDTPAALPIKQPLP